MSHFFGTLEGQAGEATRRGSKKSGLVTYAAGWSGAVRVTLHHDEASQEDRYTVQLVPWQNYGDEERVLAEGVLDARRAK